MSSMEGCCKFIEKLNGELYGFIHSAGVLQDSMLMNLTWEKFETVFQSLGNRVSPCQTSGGNQTSLRCFPVFKILTVFYSPISPISPSQSPDVSRCLQMSPDVSRCLQMSPDVSSASWIAQVEASCSAFPALCSGAKPAEGLPIHVEFLFDLRVWQHGSAELLWIQLLSGCADTPSQGTSNSDAFTGLETSMIFHVYPFVYPFVHCCSHVSCFIFACKPKV